LVTIVLISINVLVFLYIVVLTPRSLGGRATSVHTDLALFGPAVADGEWYRLVTSGFLHYGIIHLAFNMYLLYVLGLMLEPAIGRVRFLLVYFAGLLGGSAGALLLSPDSLTAGASGAVFGLLGLAFVGYYLNGTNPMSTAIGSLLMINLLITFMWRDSISVGGHLGGAAAGAVCALAIMAPRHKQVPVWLTYATPAAIIVLSVVVSELAVR
jgi:membrane associated rhomboid family serine protease